MTPQYQDWYNQRVADLQGLYAPQIAGIQQQVEQLPQMYEAQKSSLQQAKENAFRDITKTAARGGMFFTGFTPREQARYLGEKYLPGLQTLSQQELAARQGLLNQITNIQGQQKAAGLSYLDTLRGYQRADELAAKQLAATKSSGSSSGGFDAQALIDALNKGSQPGSNQTTTTATAETVDPAYSEVRTSIQNDNATKIFQDIQKLIFAAKQSGIVSASAKTAAVNKLKIYAAILKNYSKPGININMIPVEYGGTLQGFGGQYTTPTTTQNVNGNQISVGTY